MIILLGESQGGAVSAISAGRNKDIVNGLIMYYPAFVVPDWVHEMFKTKEDITVRFNFMWLPLGRKYAEDVWDYDPYSEIGSYDKPVLLMHGDKDELVPLFYADEAAKCYKDIDYYVIKDGQHGFTGDKEEQANKYLLDYLLKIKVIQ